MRSSLTKRRNLIDREVALSVEEVRNQALAAEQGNEPPCSCLAAPAPKARAPAVACPASVTHARPRPRRQGPKVTPDGFPRSEAGIAIITRLGDDQQGRTTDNSPATWQIPVTLKARRRYPETSQRPRENLPDEDLKAEVERVRRENEALKQRTGKAVSLKVSEKGGVSVYGLGRFPITLYQEQWTKLLDMTDQIREFIAEHKSELKKE